MHTSLKGGELFVVLRFFMSVIQILHEFQSDFCAVFLAFLISNTNNQTNQRGGP